jgi:glucan phosphoethanolaminetransferase (alkaline phosphatase superfamily)
LVYVGDHGENLLDDERNMFLHGTFGGSKYEYHVPLFVWASPAYRKGHTHQWAAMQENTSKCISTMTLFHSLLDLGDLQYPHIDSTLLFTQPTLVSQPVIYGFDANMVRVPLPTK